MAAGLDICGSLEMASIQRGSSTAAKLLLGKESVSKLDRLSTQNANKVSVFLDVAAASQMLLTAIRWVSRMVLVLPARRKSSREYPKTWTALQACNTMLDSATQSARLIITDSALPVGPILQRDG